MPILAVDQVTLKTPAGDGNRPGVLLPTVNVVREAVVRDDVIELPDRLIVLRGPVLSAVKRYCCTFIICADHAFRVEWVNPKPVIVIARRI